MPITTFLGRETDWIKCSIGGVAMNSRELMIAAMRREPTERIPTMPQICHDLPVRLYAGEPRPARIGSTGCGAASRIRL